ncbi:aminoglycoside N3-acetyltransferase [Alkalibacterium sp. AK22]|uniref:aminoglycoside N(3)-acetyltransferase n=1 Tax=Alkalibacterium sp. AK22 TaxID=1229520 RepID=UPI0004484402|nr:AAC(3) family N-acetyltransferase [Alkalibacterium sp. AK22]EXJ23854.1 aminoglycoside N3-acetyltransferase [Alkalibacterium sp. AK22]
MREQLIKETPYPNTRASLSQELKQAGVEKDQVLLVHTSLSKVGWVNGGATAFVDALMSVIDPAAGTLVMPTQSGDWSEPSNWQHPPVPQSWWETIRETMPAFDPRKTPCPYMGVVADLFRTYPMVLRSNHPAVSFAAWGAQAGLIVERHDLDFGLGEGSPLKTLYDLDARILAVGTDYDTSTAMHLGEYRAPHAPVKTEGAPILLDKQRVWQTYQDVDLDEDQFPAVGRKLEAAGLVQPSKIGNAAVKLYSLRDAADFSERHFTDLRNIKHA